MKKIINIRIVCIISVLLLVLSGIIALAYSEQSLQDNFLKSEKVINVKDMGAKGDGTTDDTRAIQRALDNAHAGFKTIYFPAGTYRVTGTLTLESSEGKFVSLYGEGPDKTIIAGDAALNGNVITSGMRSGFKLQGLTIKHDGIGSCVDTVYINALNCAFESSANNTKDVLVFAGSNCRITECTFNGANKDVYLIRHMYKSTIAINSFIIDNKFTGAAKGIIVGSEGASRIEGLKINGNLFTNTGVEQIRMQTILHCDVSNNIMQGSQGSAIVIVPEGLMVHGLFICSNTIQASKACVYEAPMLKGSTDIHVSDNVLKDSEYGVSMHSTMGLLIVDNNIITGMKSAGIEFSEVQNGIVCKNNIEVIDGGVSVSVFAVNSKIIITDNNLNTEMDNTIQGGTQIIERNKVS